ncbi:SulP family inorganic anion transporter, partial [Bullifex sp.]|uniref:SulP family inorganic anion transporter n=1 Tax=Bullifex sp. TaxID=2815808 RepID=UPI002A82AF10
MQINNYFTILKKEFRGYNASAFMKDALAGITCTAVALPLALAFGVSSGADAASGLICAIIAGLVIGGLSGASYQISGPTGAMAAILLSLSATYGLQGVFAAGFLSGLLLLLFAIFKIGKLVSFIPKPVITGFTSGIAIIIALGQVDNAFGTVSQGSSAIAKLGSYFTLGFHPALSAVFYTVLCALIMILWPKKFNKVFPSSLLAIIVALVVQLIFNLDVATVGAIPRTLLPEERLMFSSLNPAYLVKFLSPALSIALLGMIESLLCGASGGKMKGEKIDATQELYAQGIGNALIPFFGGIPATAAIARTSVAIKSGGVTRMVSVIHSVGLLLSMFLLSPLMAKIPLAALSGVLMVTAWRMNEWETIHVIFSKKLKTSIAQFLVTMIATVVFDLTTAIIIGVGLSMLLFVLRASSDLTIEVEKASKDTCAIFINGMLFFGNQDKITAVVNKLASEGFRKFVFSLRGVSQIDHSGAEELGSILEECKARGFKVALCGLQSEVETMLERVGVEYKEYKSPNIKSV